MAATSGEQDAQIRLYQVISGLALQALGAFTSGDHVRAYARLDEVRRGAAALQELIQADAAAQGVTIHAASSRP